MAGVIVEVGARTGGLQTGLAKAEKLSEDFKKRTQKRFRSIGTTIVAALGVRSVFAGIDSLTAKYDRLAKLTKQNGDLNVDFFQKAAFAAEQSGASVEAVAKGMNRLLISTRNAEQGQKLYNDAFAELGINAKEFAELDQEQRFRRLADAVKDSADADRAKAAVLQLMGTRASELIPLLNEGADGFDNLTRGVRTLSKDDLESIEAYRDAINQIKTTLTTIAAGRLANILKDIAFGLEGIFGDDADTVQGQNDVRFERQRRLVDASNKTIDQLPPLIAQQERDRLRRVVADQAALDLGAATFLSEAGRRRGLLARTANADAPSAALNAASFGGNRELFRAMLVELQTIARKEPEVVSDASSATSSF